MSFVIGQKNNLGQGEEVFGDINDILHLLDRADAVRNGLGVLSLGGIEKSLDVLENSTISERRLEGAVVKSLTLIFSLAHSL